MSKKPLILITPSHDTQKGDLNIRANYQKAITDAGGVPIVLSLEISMADLKQAVDLADGVMFTGGPDVHPMRYGECTYLHCGSVSALRDELELALLPIVMEQKKPILGICRGIQLLNVGLGGTLYQDIPTQTSPQFPLAHQQPFFYTNYSHTISIDPDSKLGQIFGKQTISVNSMHHQAIKTPAPQLEVTAYAPDGLAEAVELKDYPYFIGVQWHPEYLYTFDEYAQKLFQSFVDACKCE